MTKKINISSKPSTTKSMDDWVSNRENPTSEKKKRLTIDIDHNLHSLIKVECAKNGIKMADKIREILKSNFLEK